MLQEESKTHEAVDVQQGYEELGQPPPGEVNGSQKMIVLWMELSKVEKTTRFKQKDKILTPNGAKHYRCCQHGR